MIIYGYITSTAACVFKKQYPGIYKNMPGQICRESGLYVEAEVHYVAVLHHVFLAFDAQLAGLTHALLAAERYIIVIFDDLGADEALLEVGMDDTCALWRLGAAAECPCAYFVGACREVGLEVE